MSVLTLFFLRILLGRARRTEDSPQPPPRGRGCRCVHVGRRRRDGWNGDVGGRLDLVEGWMILFSSGLLSRDETSQKS